MDSIGPISDSIWESIDGSDFSQIAAGSPYGERFNTFDLDTAKLNKKNKAALEKQNRYSFGLYDADQSYSVAKMMALAFIDTTIAAFTKAAGKRGLQLHNQIMFHLDRGVQYACTEFTLLLKEYNCHRVCPEKEIAGIMQ